MHGSVGPGGVGRVCLGYIHYGGGWCRQGGYSMYGIQSYMVVNEYRGETERQPSRHARTGQVTSIYYKPQVTKPEEWRCRT